eukprot:gene3460-3731_t
MLLRLLFQPWCKKKAQQSAGHMSQHEQPCGVPSANRLERLSCSGSLSAVPLQVSKSIVFEQPSGFGAHESSRRRGLLEELRLAAELCVTGAFDTLRLTLRRVHSVGRYSHYDGLEAGGYGSSPLGNGNGGSSQSSGAEPSMPAGLDWFDGGDDDMGPAALCILRAGRESLMWHGIARRGVLVAVVVALLLPPPVAPDPDLVTR